MAGGKGTIANLQGKVNADNELVVAATVQSGPAVITDGADPAIEATVKDYSNSNPLAVVVMDTNGDPAALAGGTQYAQGSASTDTDTATMAGVVRKDTPAIATGVADGDRTLLSVDSAGLAYTRLRQQLDGDSGAGTQATDVVLLGLPGSGGPVAGGTSTNPLQVSLANTAANATAVKVDGSAVTQPVSAASLPLPTGASTSANQTTANTALSGIQTAVEIMDDWDESDRAKVNPIVGQAGVAGGSGTVGATTQRVVLATDVALPAGTNAIGKLSANSGVDIGDVDVTSLTPGTAAGNLGKAEDAAHASGDTGVMSLAVRQDAPNSAFAGTDADYSPIAVSSTGAVRTAPPSEDFAALANGPQVKKYYANTGAVTDGIVWSPAAGKRWYVTDIILNVSAAGTVTFEDDKAGGDEAVMKFEFAANSGISHSFATPWFSGEDAADLLVTTTAGNVYITITGYEI
jgi:hypothetical protein